MIAAIDSHQHFWDPAKGDYSWMTADHDPIRRVFGPRDLRGELDAAGVSHTILVQTWSSTDETRAFLHLADRTDFVAGVVGWVDLTSQQVGETLDGLLAGPGGKWLVGIRHQVHDEADPDWLLRDDVLRGLEEVSRRGLVYDLLVRPRELPAALGAVQANPQLRLVVDHMAKPDIGGGSLNAWSDALSPLAEYRRRVWCKLSGLVTEADWASRNNSQFTPYLEAALGMFGPDRCMFGSDWPVCLLAGGYERTLKIVKDAVAYLPDAEREAVLRGNAVSAYRLDGVVS